MTPSRRTFLLGLAGAACLTARPGAQASQTGKRLVASDVHVSDYPSVEAVRWIGQELARATDGRLSIEAYHSGQLGRELDQIDMARHGAIDITRVYTGALNNAFPLTIPLGLPYLFQSKAHLRRIIDGPIGKQVLDGFNARGLVGLAIFDCGARSVYSTKGPIVRPADMAGLKLRIPPSDIFLKLMSALGANPTPLPYGDVFSALETRLIDGAENNVRSFQSSRQFEIARYWSETEHSFAPDVLLMSGRNFLALSPDDQALIRELAARSVQVFRDRWDAGEAESRRTIESAGVQIQAVDREAFVAASAPVLAEYRQHPDLADMIATIGSEAD
ncbi:C4-dicarboxylate ABC transporter [Ahniella affigens]|uniref:C4-dicarboxylate ABC transporter n=1 Tax=Ahniella affigens TaxID=2021234 RepID=A0A2P1PTU2_9GAMM|nr:TRAP transporter substrate-binding protein [Ahniella affigens]AVP98269.1 C4-dicarboxylate ABC transporter [Ahniella affigens]